MMWRLLLLATTPAMPLHETAHYAAARLGGARAHVELDGEGGAETVIDWPASASRHWVRVTHLAPTLLSLGLGLLALPALPWLEATVAALGTGLAHSLGVPALAAECRLFMAVYLAVNAVVFAWPSPSDRRPFAA